MRAFDEADYAEEGLTIPDILRVFEQVSLKMDSEMDIENLLTYYRIKKNRKGRYSYNQLVNKIFKEDFNPDKRSAFDNKNIRPETMVLNRIRKELSYFKNIDLTSIMAKFSDDNSGQKLISKKNFLIALEDVISYLSKFIIFSKESSCQRMKKSNYLKLFLLMEENMTEFNMSKPSI